MFNGPVELLRGGPEGFLEFAILMVAIIEAIALHEFAHAYVADLQGDRMPRAMGRLTLNPLAHLDPLGTIFIALVGFGWGKPVEFRRSSLSSQRFGAAMVALAGPAMNLVLALVGAVVARVLGAGVIQSGGLSSLSIPEGFTGILARAFLLFSSINVVLAVFNLIPLPPLDGSRLLTIFLPPNRQNIIFFLDRYGFLILLGLVIFGGTTILGPVISSVQSFILNLVFF